MLKILINPFIEDEIAICVPEHRIAIIYFWLTVPCSNQLLTRLCSHEPLLDLSSMCLSSNALARVAAPSSSDFVLSRHVQPLE